MSVSMLFKFFIPAIAVVAMATSGCGPGQPKAKPPETPTPAPGSGTSPASLPETAPQTPPQNKAVADVPENYGVFMRMKDGSLVTLERQQVHREEILGGRRSNGYVRIWTDHLPRVMLHPDNIDHLILRSEKPVNVGDCGFKGLRGYVSSFDLVEITIPNQLLVTKLASEIYKLTFEDPSEWSRVLPKLVQYTPYTGDRGLFGNEEDPKPIVGLAFIHEGASYQFGVKLNPEGPPIKSYTLDNAKLEPSVGKPVASTELGFGLQVYEQDKSLDLVVYAWGYFDPANLDFSGDFTARYKFHPERKDKFHPERKDSMSPTGVSYLVVVTNKRTMSIFIDEKGRYHFGDAVAEKLTTNNTGHSDGSSEWILERRGSKCSFICPARKSREESVLETAVSQEMLAGEVVQRVLLYPGKGRMSLGYTFTSP